jgi:uncharacterized protein with GYD domain
MPKYMYICTYSSGSWARLLRISDDRLRAIRELMESLGGSLDCAYWEVSARAAYAVADMPDSACAAAAAAVLNHSGAFKGVEVHEVFTHDQFTGMLDLAENVSGKYKVPGSELLADDSARLPPQVRRHASSGRKQAAGRQAEVPAR